MNNYASDIESLPAFEYVFLILLPLFGLAIGLLLLKRPDFLSELEILGFKPVILTRRLAQFFGFMFTIFSIVFLVVGIITIINAIWT